MIFKKFMARLLVLALGLILYSCNGDVFVPDTRPSAMRVELNGDGDSTVIAYQPEGLVRVGLQHLFSFPIQVYNRDGQLVNGDVAPSELGRVVIKGPNIDMALEAVPGGIKVKVNENLYIGGATMFLELDYGYTYHSVEIMVKQCSPYDILDVRYDMESMRVFGPWAENATTTFTINNNSDQDIRITDTPLINAYSSFLFEMDASVRLLTNIDDNPQDIPIPTFRDKEAGMHGRTVNFGFAVSNAIAFEPTVDRNVKVGLSVPANSTRRFFLYIQHMELIVPVRIVIKNPVNGHVRDITGKLTVKEPTGFFYGSQDVTE